LTLFRSLVLFILVHLTNEEEEKELKEKFNEGFFCVSCVIHIPFIPRIQTKFVLLAKRKVE
jgi:hypothetical protein